MRHWFNLFIKDRNHINYSLHKLWLVYDKQWGVGYIVTSRLFRIILGIGAKHFTVERTIFLKIFLQKKDKIMGGLFCTILDF